MAASRPSRGLISRNKPSLADILRAIKMCLSAIQRFTNMISFRDVFFMLTLLRWTRVLYFQLRGVGVAGTVSVCSS